MSHSKRTKRTVLNEKQKGPLTLRAEEEHTGGTIPCYHITMVWNMGVAGADENSWNPPRFPGFIQRFCDSIGWDSRSAPRVELHAEGCPVPLGVFGVTSALWSIGGSADHYPSAQIFVDVPTAHAAFPPKQRVWVNDPRSMSKDLTDFPKLVSAFGELEKNSSMRCELRPSQENPSRRSLLLYMRWADGATPKGPLSEWSYIALHHLIDLKLPSMLGCLGSEINDLDALELEMPHSDIALCGRVFHHLFVSSGIRMPKCEVGTVA